MKHLKYFKINESLSNNDLAKELLSGESTWIEPVFIGGGKKWGVVYYINKEKKQEGNFNTSEEVYKFLEELGVSYKGKEGFQIMTKFRDKEVEKVPFKGYQKYLSDHGLDDLFE